MLVAFSAAEKVPAAQSEQLDCRNAPVALSHVPAGQGCGAAPAAQKKPMAQGAAAPVEPSGQLVPAPQGAQVALDVAPVATEKEPPGHGTHTAWPAALSAPKVPAAHGAQVAAAAEAWPKGPVEPSAQGVPAQAAAPAAAE